MWFLVIWHSLAMVVGAMPDSALASMVRPIFRPYLTLFRLDNGWGFFAPNVEPGMLLRYVVQDAAGTRHEFTPTDKLSRFAPNWIWMSDRFRMVIFDPDKYAETFGLSLCQEHAELKPVSVSLVRVDQERFWPEHWMQGKHPLDAEFIQARPFKVIQCPQT
jgi:hypothetical protein